VSSSQHRNSAWAGTRVNSAVEEPLVGLDIYSECWDQTKYHQVTFGCRDSQDRQSE